MNIDLRTAGPDPSDLDARADLCRDLALSAGRIALEGLGRADRSFRLKGAQDFLTETDAAVEDHLRAAIAAAFPGDAFLGEEGGGRPGRETWVVDPIDGTANFARGVPHFCVSIAFVRDGATEIGAICNPVLGELHFARRGAGVVRNGAPVRVAATSDFAAACVELGWSNRVPNARYLEAMAALLELGANVRRGASGALGLAWVADGRSDGYAEAHMNAWDCLAGLLMVEEAGGRVGRFLELGGLERGGPVIAAAPGIAEGFAAATGLALRA
ncbi:inositol monophosphatase family protein [Amaricoccus sp.]|uniref:inositol monophosphatase family protein n=1 Tax=Amaricoccus sp. TaxID=1872485 RepID=UPI0026219F46|nr:inositol monophosphatase family protein [Amaricoccus sp.]HRO10178.1 inositol monophosphatase family protein [Amaricoccus sp.]